ncbi:F-box/FBD/LRR-repeat protein At1g78750-like isoform X3 [Amaranthus tricolor]|uniref:F-box/FBD/LRR-repeat protein At1g78750-like isoform X3 n=1 Tax=Amaranthus tricolor TaxID=29722 RepID=UPI0025859D38|nr:F-box/FBD/LRR-repeat protein At1g78750-like isoform X3 [Amaranthus tricolor]
MNKKKKVEQMDLISNLPDHLIVRIISLLPTHEAVRTCILSMRWKYLWKGIDSISLMGYESDPAKFRFLVEHILINCNTTNLLSFVLFCPSRISLSRLNSWIRKAIGTKIEKLTLSVDTLFPGLPALSVLPQCVLASNTLVSLKLDSFFDISVPDSILCFPYLKSLELDLLLPDQCNVMHRLLSSSPVLEQLFVNGHLDSADSTNFDICVRSPLKLSLHLEYQGDGDDEDDTSEYVITIDTPRLRYLSIMDDSLSQYVVKNLVRVHKAEIMYQTVCLEALEPKHVNSLFELLKGVSAAEVLALHSFTSDVLGSALGLTWPLFPNLKMLEIDLHDLSGRNEYQG